MFTFIHKHLRYILGVLLVCFGLLYLNNYKFDVDFVEHESITIQEISDEEVYSVPDEKLIFFLETSRHGTEELINIKPRQACVLESAVRANKNHTIYFLYLPPKDFEYKPMYLNISNSIQELLKGYANLKFRRLDLIRYSEKTLMDGWFHSDALKKSDYPIEHTSDVLRLFTLWKYGGTYLDLDVVVMKDIQDLGSNFVAAESEYQVSNAILNFGRSGIGHDFVNSCLMEVKKSFNGKTWSYNGPQLIQRILGQYCNTTNFYSMDKETCKGLDVLKAWYFCPIEWQSWERFFDTQNTNETLKVIERSYGVHVWNKLSHELIIDKQQKEAAFGVIAQQNCPNVYRESGRFF